MSALGLMPTIAQQLGKNLGKEFMAEVEKNFTREVGSGMQELAKKTIQS